MTGATAYKRWWMFALASAFFFFITASTFSSLGVVLPYMIEEFSWTWSQAGTGFSLLALLVGLAGTLPAWTIRRFGIKATYVIGSVTMGCGFVLISTGSWLYQYWLGASLLGLGYALCATVPGIHLINDWLPDRRSFAIGLYMTLGGLGAVAGPPIVTIIVTHTDSWRVHWWSMAAAVLALTVLAFAFINNRSSENDEADAANTPGEEKTSDKVFKTKTDWRYRDALRTPQYYVIVAALTLTLFCTLTMNSWAFTHLGMLGISTALATLALSADGAVNAMSRALGGIIATRIDPKWLLVTALIGEMIGMVALSVADNPAALVIFAVGEGFGFGMCFLATALLLLNYFGEKDNPEILGTMNFMTTIAMLGPIVAGYIGDKAGGFSMAFQLNAALMLIVIIAVAVMKPPRQQQQD
ncbi:MAG: MFS transporter [Gammaproteobacteria bacterium]|nr:MFS transporter [Gammaproteobacteria bacterium]